MYWFMWLCLIACDLCSIQVLVSEMYQSINFSNFEENSRVLLGYVFRSLISVSVFDMDVIPILFQYKYLYLGIPHSRLKRIKRYELFEIPINPNLKYFSI